MLSQTNEYALRVAVNLARHDPHTLTTGELATLTGVPRGYLAKVLQQLRRADLVIAQRGARGGFRLGRAATAMTALDVVNAIDPLVVITECPLGRSDHRHQLCPLHQTLSRVGREFAHTLQTTSLADLTKDPSSGPLCQPAR